MNCVIFYGKVKNEKMYFEQVKKVRVKLVPKVKIEIIIIISKKLEKS
jgi:hypothetical protein